MGKRQSPTPTLAQLRKLDEMSEEVKCICGSGLYNERHKDRQVPHAPNCPKYSPAPQVSCPVPDAPNVPGCQKSDNPELRKWLYHAPTCPDAKPAPQAEDGGKVEAIWDNTTICFGNDCPNCERERKNKLAPEPKPGSEELIPEEALHIAAQCWCDPETSDRVMDPPLATAFARRLVPYLALRSKLTAARDEIAKLRKFVSEAMHEVDAEKARADKAEQRVREAFDEAAKAVCPGCGRRALQYITEASGPNSAHNWTHDRVDGEGDPMLCAASAIHSLRARQEQKEGGR